MDTLPIVRGEVLCNRLGLAWELLSKQHVTARPPPSRLVRAAASGSVVTEIAVRVGGGVHCAGGRAAERRATPDDAAPTEGAPAAPYRRRAHHPRTPHSCPPRGGRSGRAGDHPTGRGRRGPVHRRRAAGRAPLGAGGGAAGGPLQRAGARRAGHAAWGWASARVWPQRVRAHSAGSASPARSGARWHRHLVPDDAPAGVADGPGRLTPGEHLDHPAGLVAGRVHLAGESHLVRDGHGAAQAQGRHGPGH
jgi:hypothetical protein